MLLQYFVQKSRIWIQFASAVQLVLIDLDEFLHLSAYYRYCIADSDTERKFRRFLGALNFPHALISTSRRKFPNGIFLEQKIVFVFTLIYRPIDLCIILVDQ